MRNSIIVTIALVLVLGLLFNLPALAATRSFTGTVTDTMCGKQHMVPGKSDAECTRQCMSSKGDWTYGLVSGDEVYTLSGDQKQLAVHAGKRVKVTGELTGKTLTVNSIVLMP